MKVYCYDCNTSEETEWLVRCPRCETRDIGVEPDKGWHLLCRLFAFSQRWEGDQGTISLPWFFQMKPDALAEWEAFKARLIDPEAIQPPPEQREVMNHGNFFDFWLYQTGIVNLSVAGAGILMTPVLGGLIRQLGNQYAAYHIRTIERERMGKVIREEEEKLRAEGSRERR